MLFTIESLRLAFARLNSDQLICVVTLNNEGALSVKILTDSRLFLIESIILSQTDDDEESNKNDNSDED